MARTGRSGVAALKFVTSSLVALVVAFPALAWADSADPIGDLLSNMAAKVKPIFGSFDLKATLYHGGTHMSSRDSLGCKVVPMRTAAVDGVKVPRHSILFIKETVGLKLPDGSRHDGFWYASDTGGAIHEGRIDLFTGQGAGSMSTLMPLNLAKVTVALVGKFDGCPKQ
ncbi:MAG TPA: 3D domain-containing protein [Caulobacteraceae bacterium]|jgi:3D (Asp-Asp-Asp) domain-containing protein